MTKNKLRLLKNNNGLNILKKRYHATELEKNSNVAKLASIITPSIYSHTNKLLVIIFLIIFSTTTQANKLKNVIYTPNPNNIEMNKPVQIELEFLEEKIEQRDSSDPLGMGSSKNGGIKPIKCGIKLYWGDGAEQKLRLGQKVKPPFRFKHTYKKEGKYNLRIKGKSMRRGFNSVSECDAKYSQAINVVNPVHIQKKSAPKKKLSDEKRKVQLELTKQKTKTKTSPQIISKTNKNTSCLSKKSSIKQNIKNCLNDAKQGDKNAQANLGALYMAKGESRDLNKSFKWYERSAQQGVAYAQHSLAAFYKHGSVVKKDYKKAEYWFSKSAQQGGTWGKKSKESLAKLRKTSIPNIPTSFTNKNTSCYANNDTNKNNFTRCLKQAENGNIDAQVRVAGLYLKGKGVKKNITEAFNWYKKSAELGHPVGQYSTGVILTKVSNPNYEKAIYWLKMAAEQGHTKSKLKLTELQAKLNSKTQITSARNKSCNLKYVNLNDYSVRDRFLKKLSQCENEAKNGNITAQYEVAGLYNKMKKKNKSLNWYFKAAQNGHPISQTVIGRHYYSFDYENSEKWLLKAAKNNQSTAQVYLAYLYEGVQSAPEAPKGRKKNDYEKAAYWYEKALNNGENVKSELIYVQKKLKEQKVAMKKQTLKKNTNQQQKKTSEVECPTVIWYGNRNTPKECRNKGGHYLVPQ